MKPKKVPFWEYYSKPLKYIKDSILYHLGYWYCDYCKRRHHPRVKSYGGIVNNRIYCSFGKHGKGEDNK